MHYGTIASNIMFWREQNVDKILISKQGVWHETTIWPQQPLSSAAPPPATFVPHQNSRLGFLAMISTVGNLAQFQP